MCLRFEAVIVAKSSLLSYLITYLNHYYSVGRPLTRASMERRTQTAIRIFSPRWSPTICLKGNAGRRVLSHLVEKGGMRREGMRVSESTSVKELRHKY